MSNAARDTINRIASAHGHSVERWSVTPRQFKLMAEELRKHPAVQGGLDSMVRIDEKEYLNSYIMIGKLKVVPLCS